ncbi:MAG: hypothetical protein B9S38_15885, partial [Verrucomicrobiia bacterium Tous-C4TDCM]
SGKSRTGPQLQVCLLAIPAEASITPRGVSVETEDLKTPHRRDFEGQAQDSRHEFAASSC